MDGWMDGWLVGWLEVLTVILNLSPQQPTEKNLKDENKNHKYEIDGDGDGKSGQ